MPITKQGPRVLYHEMKVSILEIKEFDAKLQEQRDAGAISS